MQTKADYLFEVSWEVCNRVGGIYTVVKSKAKLLKKNYRNYFAIGPYIEKNAELDFTKQEIPRKLRPVFDELKKEGIICHFGKWNIKGEPNVILVEPHCLKDQKDYYKKKYWEDFKVDSLNAEWEFDEPLMWATAVGLLLEKISKRFEKEKIVAQFHEWMSGFALLYLKTINSNIGTVFTTHATMLGRSIAGSGDNLYAMLDKINPEQEARKRNVISKFSTEKACAQNSDVFTTVSEITSIEAEKLLGRKADVLLLNGLDSSQFPSFEDISLKHKKSKQAIHEFLSYYFFPYYSFDLDNSLNIFIVGRYEYRNKGMDIFIKALARLNNELKKRKAQKKINAFFWVPTSIKSTRPSLSDSKSKYIQIREYIEDHSEKIIEQIKDNFLTTPIKDIENSSKIKCGLFGQEFLSNIKKMKINFAKEGHPPISTHILSNEEEDPIINTLKESGLDNREDDVVKAIFYPIYLTGVDGLLDLNYYDAVIGCHLGVFPSYYEPWGYTPLESAALGVPAITTDLAGFGRFIQSNNNDGGIYVLKRFNKSKEEVVEELKNKLLWYYGLDQKNRVQEKIAAKELSSLADWNKFIENYIEAHNLSLKNVENSP